MCLSGQLMPGASLTQGICFTATTSLISSTVRPLGGEVRYPDSDDSLKDMAICPDGKKPDDETVVVWVPECVQEACREARDLHVET